MHGRESYLRVSVSFLCPMTQATHMTFTRLGESVCVFSVLYLCFDVSQQHIRRRQRNVFTKCSSTHLRFSLMFLFSWAHILSSRSSRSSRQTFVYLGRCAKMNWTGPPDTVFLPFTFDCHSACLFCGVIVSIKFDKSNQMWASEITPKTVFTV